jgi:8-oxo-dGTP pyrophosphatase MutT (NUDIX family)
MNSQTTLRDANSETPDCVGALIRDNSARVFIHRRSPTRRLFPGTWDIVGGHVEEGETALEALAREITEETGWELSRICAKVSDWQWEYEGVVRREFDYLVEVIGNSSIPRLEAGKHDAYAWVGLDNVDMMMDGRFDGDYRLRDIVVKALQWAS